ncbi:hypothetical protein [Kitasatospora sp. NPDC092286]|uniref:hypothetical protein n=1 Tax=Kitasatospora sp. NPDC092286 TaxID=3364087 RepID=UPI00382F63CC
MATRPLPGGELDNIGFRPPRYDLEPFSPDEVHRVAWGWFHAFELAEPNRVATRFTQALARSRLSDLARIPLMISMLCQLHAIRPGRPLPARPRIRS